MLSTRNSQRVTRVLPYHLMGKASASSYANIFMVRFDEKHINPFIKKKVELYLRYLNNIFLI